MATKVGEINGGPDGSLSNVLVLDVDGGTTGPQFVGGEFLYGSINQGDVVTGFEFYVGLTQFRLGAGNTFSFLILNDSYQVLYKYTVGLGAGPSAPDQWIRVKIPNGSHYKHTSGFSPSYYGIAVDDASVYESGQLHISYFNDPGLGSPRIVTCSLPGTYSSLAVNDTLTETSSIDTARLCLNVTVEKSASTFALRS